MGTVLSIAQFKEEKTNATRSAFAHEEDDPGAIVETENVLDYEKLTKELGEYLPLALHHAHNLAVFRKTSSLGAMVQFDLSTDRDAPHRDTGKPSRAYGGWSWALRLSSWPLRAKRSG